MTDSDPIPTFADTGDRVTYLLAQYRLLVAVVVLGAVGAVAYVRPTISLPTVPTWLLAWPVAVVVFAPVGVPLAVVVVSWLRNRRAVEVYEVNAQTDTVEKWLVAPETWADKTVDGADPYPVNDGETWAVREFDYDEQAGLTVAGCWPSGVSDVEWYTSQRHIENVHDWLVPKVRELVGVRELVSRIGLQVQERLTQGGAEAREKGTMLDPDTIQDAVDDVKDDLPTFDESEMPDLEDALEEEAPHRDLTPEADGTAPEGTVDG